MNRCPRCDEKTHPPIYYTVRSIVRFILWTGIIYWGIWCVEWFRVNILENGLYEYYRQMGWE